MTTKTATKGRWGASADRMRELTAKRLARRRQAPPAPMPGLEVEAGAATASPSVSVIESLAAWPEFLEPSWAAWRVFLRAIHGERLSEEELATFREHTNRQDSPTKPVRESWCVVGRRGGKSITAALIAVIKATASDYRDKLARGERPVVVVVAADRTQAGIIVSYCRGLLESVPEFKRMMLRGTKDTIPLRNGVTIEVRTASFRTTRGYTMVAAIADEVAFWRDEATSSNPDVEVLAAIRPALMTLKGPLVCVSTPYSKSGACYAAYAKHFGKPSDVLVWSGTSLSMNPNLPKDDIDAAYAADPQSARAEYGGEFRDDVASFLPDEVLEAAVVNGRFEIPPTSGHRMVAFVDCSGGVSDSFALALAHPRNPQKASDGVVLDYVEEIPGPCSPEAAIERLAKALKKYGIKKVVGDAYAGEFPREQFTKHGIQYEVSARSKSECYLAALPLFTSKAVELLDSERLLRQLRGLERRTSRGGRDSVDHGPGGKDDLANAVCGALALAAYLRPSGGYVAPSLPGRRVTKEMRAYIDIARGGVAAFAGKGERETFVEAFPLRVPGATGNRELTHPHERRGA